MTPVFSRRGHNSSLFFIDKYSCERNLTQMHFFIHKIFTFIKIFVQLTKMQSSMKIYFKSKNIRHKTG